MIRVVVIYLFGCFVCLPSICPLLRNIATWCFIGCDQVDETEGLERQDLEMDGLERERMEREGVKRLRYLLFQHNLRNMYESQ
jgi:hypothetical protein